MKRKKIVILHYHLRPGGVTKVIEHQVSALKESCDLMILSGDECTNDILKDFVGIVPELNYDMIDRFLSATQTVEKIFKVIGERWTESPDIFHFHNPTLIKNKNIIKIIKGIQDRGFKILLQVHDFAEDGRSDFYTKESYPSNCHYAVINIRDWDYLHKAGLEKKGLHFLPNMVSFDYKDAETMNEFKDIVLYPVRGIRRKNLGEAILLSLFFNKGEKLLVTLPPKKGEELNIFNDWKIFCKNNHLNVQLGSESNVSFTTLAISSKCVITTSITEGFGFTYLEPWLYNKVIIGRKIPVCSFFEKEGIKFPGMYTQINVPIEWIGKDVIKNIFSVTLRESTKKLFHEMSARQIKKEVERFFLTDNIDFGLLDEKMQKEIMVKILKDDSKRSTLIKLNPFLGSITKFKDMTKIVSENQKIIQGLYSAEKYKKNLLSVYNKVKDVKPVQVIDKKKLQKYFLDLSGLSLLKWKAYEK